jgi:hypothetical protein
LREIAHAHHDHVERVEDTGVRSWTGARACGWSASLTAESAIASVTSIASVAAIAAAAVEAATRTEAAATAAVIIPSAEAAATAATTTRGRRRSRTVELQLGRHRLAAVLRELKRTALTFA